jgi:peptide/nickel transport system substrate-binding protein
MSRFFAAGAALALMGVCAALPAEAAGVLRIGQQEEPDALDPARGGTFGGRFAFTAMCDKLWDLAPDLSFRPQLATAWKWSDDNRALTITLRDGVVLHDGTPMTAEVVRANLERYRAAPESNRKGELRSVTAVEVVDAKTVRMVLSQPFAPLLAALSDRAGMIASPSVFQRLGADFFKEPVCSGPFKYVERVAQDRIVLERFPGYWDAGRVHVDRVVFRMIPDSTVRLVNLQAGQLDMLQDLSPSDAGKVRGDAKLKLVTSPGLGYAAIGINTAHGPRADTPFGRDPRVRAAFEAAIDRNVINQVALEGLFVPNNQTELPASPYFNKAIPVPGRDVAKARALLKEAGVEKLEIELQVAKTPRDVQVAEIIQAMAAEAGIEVKVRSGESVSNIQAMTRGDYQSSIHNWSGRADPDLNISIYIAADSFQNWGKYNNPAFEAALARGRAETDPVRRAAAYAEVTRIYTTDRPMIPLYNTTWLFALSGKVSGFVAVPDGLIRIQGMKVE